MLRASETAPQGRKGTTKINFYVSNTLCPTLCAVCIEGSEKFCDQCEQYTVSANRAEFRPY